MYLQIVLEVLRRMINHNDKLEVTHLLWHMQLKETRTRTGTQSNAGEDHLQYRRLGALKQQRNKVQLSHTKATFILYY